MELVATIRRVTQMARDWGVPTWLVKLDIRKAFDSVWQHSMGELVAARVGGVPSDRCPVPANGGEQPWEANLWLSVLETRALNIAVGDVLTTVPQTNGIRQGSPDSPDLFGAIVARDLASAIQAAPAQPPDSKGGPPPPKTGGCFLDDTYLWSQNKQHLQATLEGLEAELHEDGLSIHPTKTAILYSQPTGGGTLRIAGEEVECCPHKTVITTLGSPISFGEQTTMIIAEMGRRSRNAFHKHKAVLKTKSSLKSRALAHITLVRNAGLYACETWPAHHRILKAANSIQTTHYRDMLHIHRQPTESWASWHTRSLRQARAHMHREGIQRWSTYILRRIWQLWGHMARGGRRSPTWWPGRTWLSGVHNNSNLESNESQTLGISTQRGMWNAPLSRWGEHTGCR